MAAPFFLPEPASDDLPYIFKESDFIRQHFPPTAVWIEVFLFYTAVFPFFAVRKALFRFHTAILSPHCRTDSSSLIFYGNLLRICRIKCTFSFSYGTSSSDLPYNFGFSIFVRQIAARKDPFHESGLTYTPGGYKIAM